MVYRYLLGEEMGTLEILMEVEGDKFVEFGNNAVAFGLITAVTFCVPGANLTEALRVGLAEVEFANPYLIENAKETTKLVKLVGVSVEWILRGPWSCWSAHA